MTTPNYGYVDIIESKDRAELMRRLGQAHRDEIATFIQFELHHRDAQEQNDRMEQYTRQMTRLTWIITGLTVVNVLLVAYSLLPR